MNGPNMETLTPSSRVGLIVDGAPAPAWQVRLLDNLARLATVSVFSPEERPASPWLWSKLAAGIPALQRDDCHVSVHRVPCLRSALAACRDADVDLVIDCTASAQLDFGDFAFRRGLWSLRQQDGRAVGEAYAFLDEVASSEPYPAIALVCDGKRALRTVNPQVPRGHYYAALDRLLSIAALLPAQALRCTKTDCRHGCRGRHGQPDR